MVKLWVLLLKRTTPTIKWYTALQIPSFSWENLKNVKAGRKVRQSAFEKEDFRGVSTNLHQVFTKLHQSAPIHTKSWQRYTSLHQSTQSLPKVLQSATICTKLHQVSTKLLQVFANWFWCTYSCLQLQNQSYRDETVIFQFWLMENKLLGGMFCHNSCVLFQLSGVIV